MKFIDVLLKLLGVRSKSLSTNVYIDGFNLYYRAVKGTPYKWLDLLKLSQAIVPSHRIHRIRYFSALIQPRTGDLQGPQRQQIYIRALKTISCLTVHLGQFRIRTIHRPLVTPVAGLPNYVWVKDTEEKGSDVNLATYLLSDGYEGDFGQAIVISNDADLALAIQMIRDKLNLPIGVVNPNLNPNFLTPKELTDAADFTRRIHLGALRSSQFPNTLQDSKGTITKPVQW